METTIYNIDYFISKFSEISEDMLIPFSQGSAESDGLLPHCTLGWCRNERGDFGETSLNRKAAYCSFSFEAYCLNEILKPLGGIDEDGWSIAGINNGTDPRYQQPTPKQRILAALYDVKKAQQPEVKERTVYVTVDQPVRELQKQELAQN